MGVPISYNLRNLRERKATTLMTAVGIALTVGVLVIALSLMDGLRATFSATGHPLQIIVMRKGSSAELNSSITNEAWQELKLTPVAARTANDQPMVSPELISVINLPSVDSPSGMNVTVRGLTQTGIEMRELQLAQGRWFTPGRREVVVGQSVVSRYASAQLGGTLRFGRGDWEVVGVFSGGKSAINSEIWCDLNQLAADLDRQTGVSSVLMRVQDASQIDPLIKSITDNMRLNAEPKREQAYYESMTTSGVPLQFLGFFIATIMAIGSAFGAMNTMYAAVARRGREIGTLRALGFSRWSILRSFMFESLMLALIGGVIGCAIALPLNGMTTGIGNFLSFSEVAFNFQVGPASMIKGLLFATVIGAIGGLLPAWAASRRNLLASLREG